MQNAVHFVRFAPNSPQFQNAVKVFGTPDFVHRCYDQRCIQEIFEGDRVVFAVGDETQPVTPYTYDDSAHV